MVFFKFKHKSRVAKATQLIEIKTGHQWYVQQEYPIYGNAHFLIKRTENGYEPTYIMLSERGVHMRFQTVRRQA